MTQQIIAFIKMSRAYFLLMPSLPYLVGLGIAHREHESLDMRLVWMGLAAQLLVQISVSYLNDYWDIETDRLNTRRTLLSGGSGELTTGILPPRVALIAGNIFQALAVLIALLAGISVISWLVLAACIIITQLYTAPPIKLVYRGLGELTTGILAGLLVPAWAYSLQTGYLETDILLIGIPLIPFIMGMMLGIATPDIEADRQVNKITLAVIAGENRIAGLYAGTVAVGYALAIGLLPTALAKTVLIGIVVSFPLASIAWMGLRQPVKKTSLGWLMMVLNTGLPTLAMLLTVNAGLWL